ncbi:MAG TPA: hypothetical protein VGL61_30565 [Kofleriaceae bacterium]|jgi:hypothetical protein
MSAINAVTSPTATIASPSLVAAESTEPVTTHWPRPPEQSSPPLDVAAARTKPVAASAAPPISTA